MSETQETVMKVLGEDLNINNPEVRVKAEVAGIAAYWAGDRYVTIPED